MTADRIRTEYTFFVIHTSMHTRTAQSILVHMRAALQTIIVSLSYDIIRYGYGNGISFDTEVRYPFT